MKRLAILGAMVLVAVACGGTGSESTTTTGGSATSTPAETSTTGENPTTTTGSDTPGSTTPDQTGARFVISGLTFGTDPMVVITNVGDQAGSLDGHFLCQRPSYEGLPDIEVGAGQSVAFSAGGDAFTPPPGVIAAEEPVAIGGLSNGGGEVGLYTSSDFGSSSAIISYVEWGSAGHGRSSVAGEAGIWSGFVPTTDATLSLSAENLPAAGPDDWSEG